MNKIKAGLFAATLSAVVASGAGVAAAAPSGAPDQSPPITFDCGTAGTYTGFANSGNSHALTWNPFFLTGSNGQTAELVPTANDIVLTDTSGSTPVVVFAPNATKGGTAGAVTCVVSGRIGSSIIVSGTVSGNLVPA